MLFASKSFSFLAMEYSFAVLCMAALTFVLGGVVKGVLGVGLPLLAVPMLSLWMLPAQAMGFLVMPVLLSNAMQAFEGGRVCYAVKRFTPLMLAQLVATLLANHWSAQLSVKGMQLVIAFTVISAVVLMVLKPHLEIAPRQEWWAGPLVGVIAGAMVANLLVAGMSGALIPLLLDRLNVDPAVAAGVFLTTVTDVVGFFVFLALGAVFLL